MLNILVTGSNGQLGSEIKELSSDMPYNLFFTTKDTLDISNQQDIKNFCESNTITAIINCAGYTAVDKAESQQDQANSINNTATASLAQVAQQNNIKLIHISTDYVFDGTNHTPYTEEDITNPQSIYGQSKLDGENAMIQINPSNSIIIRTSWMYSNFGDNFVKTMIRLGQEKESLEVIFDQIGTPTHAKDLAQTILEILPNIKNEKVELYHYSNEGVCSWYDFAQHIMRLSNLKCTIQPIESKDYKVLAKRPFYSLLNKHKIKKEYNLTIPYWADSLKVCIDKLSIKQ
ncbi:MAG: dTDP-4-dehydrorhamnose reductase [Campylobacterota bacterium]|nr:dTDP-4-dehydrorhamnose reductase [Campylobacterota bacterium]